MAKGITLHPEFGVNPSLGMCFWCGEDDGTLLLLGHNRGKEASRKTLASYDPCDSCKEGMEQGVTLVEADTSPVFENQPAIQTNPEVYPTGRYLVMKAEAVSRAFKADMAEAALRHRKAFLDVESFTRILAAYAAVQEKADG